MFRLGIDLGGTKIEGIALDENGHELFRKRVPTERDKGYDAILGKIKEIYDLLVASIDGQEHTAGIGTPGAVLRDSGLLKTSNTICMNDKPITNDIEKSIGHKIGIQNDANCFAMAEALYGAGRGKDMVFGVILGTGCGGGIVYKKEILTGLQALAGEWGHSSIDPNGPDCFCGRRGCVETFISGGGMAAQYERMFKKKKDPRDIEKDYYAGDRNAVKFMDFFFTYFGVAFANLITILDPDIIVLGGGVSKFKDIYTRGTREVEKRVNRDTLTTPIVQHQLGDSAGVIGAALIGR